MRAVELSGVSGTDMGGRNIDGVALLKEDVPKRLRQNGVGLNHGDTGVEIQHLGILPEGSRRPVGRESLR
jgi:hypothetical protein